MGKNILSIDDDEDILYTIQEIILHQGWTPLLARNFREAEHILTQYGNGRLDLILVDYHLPQPDGIQIVRRMREMGIIVSCLSCSEDYLDVGVIQRQTNLNPKTIHRYLRYLIREQMVEVKNTYGKRGRPRAFYRWAGRKR